MSKVFKDHLEWSLNTPLFNTIVDSRPVCIKKQRKITKICFLASRTQILVCRRLLSDLEQSVLLCVPLPFLYCQPSPPEDRDRAHTILIAPAWYSRPWLAGVKQQAKDSIFFPRGNNNLRTHHLPRRPVHNPVVGIPFKNKYLVQFMNKKPQNLNTIGFGTFCWCLTCLRLGLTIDNCHLKC